MTKILAFSGPKQSGKTSSTNYLVGLEMVSLGMVDAFTLNENGELVVPTSVDGQIVDGVMNFDRLTPDGAWYLMQSLWQYVKVYNFADLLKMFCVDVLGLSSEQVYGTDEEKNTVTAIKWEDLPNYNELFSGVVKAKRPKGFMTGREVMEQFGSIVRKLKTDAWSSSAINRILREKVEFAIIGDLRYPDEVEAVRNVGGKIIRLRRNEEGIDKENSHSSQTALLDFQDWDAVIDNSNMTMDEKNKEVYNTLKEWGWLEYLVQTGQPDSANNVLTQ